MKKLFTIITIIVAMFTVCSCEPMFYDVRCDNCGRFYDNSMNYCPNCGWSNYHRYYQHSYYYEYYEWCPYCNCYHTYYYNTRSVVNNDTIKTDTIY